MRLVCVCACFNISLPGVPEHTRCGRCLSEGDDVCLLLICCGTASQLYSPHSYWHTHTHTQIHTQVKQPATKTSLLLLPVPSYKTDTHTHTHTSNHADLQHLWYVWRYASETSPHILYIHTHMHIYSHTHTHTHTGTFLYIGSVVLSAYAMLTLGKSLCINVCVCVCVCMKEQKRQSMHTGGRGPRGWGVVCERSTCTHRYAHTQGWQ